MQLSFEPFTVNKRFALRISRGSTQATTNLWVRLQQDGVEGWGEASPFSTGQQPQTTELLSEALTAIAPALGDLDPWNQQQFEDLTQSLPSAARAALDLAVWDWRGKALGQPLWKLWGLDRNRCPVTSVTIGISSPEAGQDRLAAWRELFEPALIKVKLGSPEGVEADRALLNALKEVAPTTPFSVDANGGWDVATTRSLADWLVESGVIYLEQPLAKGQEADLLRLRDLPLPVFVDESAWTSQDVAALSDRVDGINLKLLKTGGLTEALRAIHTARAHGLQLMLGCYSDSSLLNSAAAQLGPLVDYLDLDSHLNLLDDPFRGATIEAGRLVPSDRPGLGVLRQE
ncbi:dipeptide epimerase [Synechococcus elongatus]|uniref:Dipeptide epimerase n=1 Tax=Synechococcus elongatus PCC 11801 TaxID=2219813 RepID=A0AAN1UU28_SYNEL|nr:dipeptide epimerase [Synechococcus elongatus]AZB72204.1 dipeptide epimerase [Synechococcus elongatus PCC 11801]